MKKITALFLFTALIFACSMLLFSCGDNSKDDQTDEKKDDKAEMVIPDGYTKYENEDFAFAYPSDWNVTTSNGIVTIKPSQGYSFIKITEEPYNSILADYRNVGANEVNLYILNEFYYGKGYQIKSNHRSDMTLENCIDENGHTWTLILGLNLGGLEFTEHRHYISTEDTTYTVVVSNRDNESGFLTTIAETFVRK